MHQGTLRFDPVDELWLPKPVAAASAQKRHSLFIKYRPKLVINPELNRTLVSFQGSKTAPFYRWFKYKEAFSSEFAHHVLRNYPAPNGKPLKVLDPFAGAGTTLTTSTMAGWEATGIELLPVGVATISARIRAQHVSIPSFEGWLRELRAFSGETCPAPRLRFPHLRITEKAFPAETEKAILCCSEFLQTIRDPDVQSLFRFAVLSVLEEVSFTRKDGQYLRWDARSGKSSGTRFNKGTIPRFWPALIPKLELMFKDISQRGGAAFADKIHLIEGSCLSVLPDLERNQFKLVLTSPPYCNRYDYTRTYALELAYLGYTEEQVKTLRQALLSATVENRSKRQQIEADYEKRGRAERHAWIREAFRQQEALQEALLLLRSARDAGKLNNNNIPGMVENYFYEMNFVIHELARLLAPGGRIVMVNDDVQYAGEEVPVDLILSDFASHAGLTVDHIWVLPRGKGNSSQQMDVHGRNELRKCAYVWLRRGSKNQR
ncbi:MAG: hypothetical protein ACRD3T_20815 [Terriglobia bacterium]